jgi:integrase
MRWRDVSLADGTLRVRGTKTENAARVVVLLPALRDELIELKTQRDPARDSLVFATTRGTKEGPSNIWRRLLAPAVTAANARLEDAGEEPIPEALTPHGLRHTFASVLLYLGEEPGRVAEQMGHADPGFTYSRYYKRMRRREGSRTASGRSSTARRSNRSRRDRPRAPSRQRRPRGPGPRTGRA